MSFTRTTAAIRFGYGLSAVETPPASPDDMLAGLAKCSRANAAAYPFTPASEKLALIRESQLAGRARRNGEAGAGERVKALQKRIRRQFLHDFRAHVARCVAAPDGFHERLQVFWNDHFSVRAKAGRFRALPSAFAEDAIRPHITGYFRDMLRASATHPAMLLYLDQNASIGPDSSLGLRRGKGLNENLARELLELHSLGVGAGYSQNDVRELAELLTGLRFTAKTGFVFRPDRAEPGAETVLGKVYGGGEPARLDEVFAALDDIAAHPATAAHIARKLAVHFVSDTPAPDLVAAMTKAFEASGGHLPTVYEALLSHPAAWQPEREKTRQPWDFVIAALRGVAVSPDAIMGLKNRETRAWLLAPIGRMGQPYQRPPGPDGWPEEAEAWITPTGLAERVTWAMNITRLPIRVAPEPRALVEVVLGGTASDKLITAVQRAGSREAGLGLIFSAPEFNRR
ncbi:MAG TPA: DUF1800 domain-containing protein [Aliiroseovarius sp.]|nr:DUF1800 domain-containing protein [Aliiroseovarius sp.]